MSTLNRMLSSPTSRWLRRSAVVSLVTFAFGCAETSAYLYRPAEHGNALVNGYPAAYYAIPPDAPKGDVRLASFGVTEVGHEEGPDLPSLHVRLIISNNAGERAWTIDTRDVRIAERGLSPRGPAFVNTGSADVPGGHIPPGQERVIDLFYPLPPGEEDPEDVPAFDVLWKVQTDAGVFAQRTPFERLRIERVAPIEWRMGYAAYWWYDPWYPGYTILRPGVIVRSHVAPPPRVHVRYPPRWWR
jgi:hypothetical protein